MPPVKISVVGSGLAAILGAGAVILAAINNANWEKFLAMAVILFLLSIILRKAKI